MLAWLPLAMAVYWRRAPGPPRAIVTLQWPSPQAATVIAPLSLPRGPMTVAVPRAM